MNKEELITAATAIAKKFIRPQEGLSLRAYPDPNSDMGKALTTIGKAKAYRDGTFSLTKELASLNPEPITIGYGQTFKGLKLGTVWLLEQAENALTEQVATRVAQVLKDAPNLLKHSPEKLAACVSLQYNVGADAFKTSTLAKLIAKDDMIGAAEQFPRWNQDNGKIVQGLVNRRKQEQDLFKSVRN